MEFEIVHKGENKIRFDPFKETKQQDIEWFHDIFKRKVDMVCEHAFKVEGNRVFFDAATDIGIKTDANPKGFFANKHANMAELRCKLEAGESFFGLEAAEEGLVDAATTPDQYFQDILFKGQKYQIGNIKPTFMQKLKAG